MNKKNYFAVFLLMIGILFRVAHPGNFGIGFDQVQILEKANQIMSGDLTLIGPRTGPTDMYTGPLIYYISVPFIYLFGEYLTIALVPASISLITGIALYFLLKKYWGNTEAVMSLTLWSFSPFLVAMDRSFWNPNLTLLASFLIFIPLLKKRNNTLSLILLFFGSFLSYQAHFSGFILVFLATAILAYRKLILPIVVILSGLFLSVTPTILFDLRNNFLNTRGLLSLSNDKGELNILPIIQNFFQNIYIILETQGKLFLLGNRTETIISLGLLMIVGYVIIKKAKQQLLPITWIFSVALIYSFYTGNKPEYYFLIVVPALIIISIDILKNLNINVQKFLLIFFVINSVFINKKNIETNSGMNVTTISEIERILSQKKVKEIAYDVPHGSDTGIRYFLNDINLDKNGDLYHISYPNFVSVTGTQSISDVGVWKDIRNEDHNYILTNTYFIETEKDVFLFEDTYTENTIQGYTSYKIIADSRITGNLYVAHKSIDTLQWVQQCLEQKEFENYDWNSIDTGYLKYSAAHCFMLIPRQDSIIDPNTVAIW